jgi:hypothetical protein
MCNSRNCSNVALSSSLRRALEAIRDNARPLTQDDRNAMAALRHVLDRALAPKGGNVLAPSNAMGV